MTSPVVSTCSKCKQTELSLPGVRKTLSVACISAGHSLSLSVDLLASRSSSVCSSPVSHKQQSSGAGSSDRGRTRSWLFSEHPSITERADQIEPARVGGIGRSAWRYLAYINTCQRVINGIEQRSHS